MKRKRGSRGGKLSGAAMLMSAALILQAFWAGFADTSCAAEQTEVPSDGSEELTVLQPQQTAEETKKDFVLALDESASLSSDEEILCDSAAQMFIDMLPLENARLAIVTFGPDYGSEAYNDGSFTEWGQDSVKIAYPLSDITTQENKDAAKDVIESERSYERNSSSQSYTPIGYALKAADAVLDEGQSADGSSAIILMSDGQVSGEGESRETDITDAFHEGLDYKFIDEAADEAKSKERPVYCIELNLNKRNDTGDWRANIGSHQMRENIPGRTGTDPISITDASQAQEAFATIFARFFDQEPETGQQTIQNGTAEFTFEIGQLVAETNITITGDITEVHSVDIAQGGGRTESFSRSDGSRTPESGDSSVFEDSYVVLKLLLPQDGTCTITVHGTDNVKVGMYAVSIRDMNLVLSSSADEVQTVGKNAGVTFTCSYYYKDRPYTSEKVYETYPAQLVVYTDDADHPTATVPMGADTGTDGASYLAEYSFEQETVYHVFALASPQSVDDTFQEDSLRSNELIFTAVGKPTVTKGSMEDQKMYTGSTLTVGCSTYFDAQDGDSLNYEAQVSGPNQSMEASVNGAGTLTVKSGDTAGTFTVTVSADDGSGEKPAVQQFQVRVVRPVTLSADYSGGREDLNFCVGTAHVPRFLMNMAGLQEENSKTYTYSDIFENPDADVVNVSYDTELTDGSGSAGTDRSISLEKTDQGVTVSSSGEGEAQVVINASYAAGIDGDASQQPVRYRITVSSQEAWTYILHRYLLLLILILAVIAAVVIVLILLFSGRKIYGLWTISGDGVLKERVRLSVSRYGKKSKCRLDDLLGDMSIPSGFGDVTLEAGNRVGKNVYLAGLRNLDFLEYGERNLTEEVQKGKVKKLNIDVGQSVVLRKSDAEVMLERRRR